MSISSELGHVNRPHRTKLVWAVFYAILAIGICAGLYGVANHIRTHTVAVGGIVLGTTYSRYAIGEPVSFTLTNNYNSAIYITNQCPAEPLAIYQQTNTGWQRIHDTANSSDCTNEQRQVSIPASSKVTYSLSPWHHLFTAPGNYRLVAIIDGYTSLPYIDFSVVSPPAPIAGITTPSTVGSNNIANIVSSPNAAVATTNTTGSTSGSTSQTPANTPQPTPTPVAPKTITLTINSSGTYDATNITLNSGDSIKFVYSPPISGEVRTHFSAVSPTTTVLNSVTLDSEYKSRTITYTTTGTWSFKADDHTGNTGTLIVK